MSAKMTKYKRKISAAEHRRRRRERRLIWSFVCSMLAVCVVAFVSLAIVNTHRDRSSTSWMIENGQMEILAPASSGMQEYTNAGSPGFRELEAVYTAAPTAVPTAIPTEAPVLPIFDSEPEDAGARLMDAIAPTEAPVAELVATAAPTAEPTEAPRAADGSTTITITAAGDVTLGGDVNNGNDKAFRTYWDQYGADYFLKNVRDLFVDDDLTVVNLEGTLTSSTQKRSGRNYNFKGEPDYVSALSGSGVDLVSLANNHSKDFNDAGYQETTTVCEGAGIGVCGYDTSWSTEIRGVRITALAYTEWATGRKQILSEIETARGQCDILIVCVHWGELRAYKPTNEQVSLGRAMVDAGADLVLGTHSHVYGRVEQYQGKYIVYSLGNLCYGAKNLKDMDSMIFRQTFAVDADGQITDAGIDIVPIRVTSASDTNNYQPILLDDEAGLTLLNSISQLAQIDEAKLRWVDGSAAASLMSRAEEIAARKAAEAEAAANATAEPTAEPTFEPITDFFDTGSLVF